MNGARATWASMIVLTLTNLTAIAQQEPQSGSQPSDQASEMAMIQRAGDDESPGPASSKMEHMADAMASMAETCDTMMRREMQMFPVKVIARGILGTIGATGLVLLVLLEVQWIRLLGLRIRQAKREFRESPSH